MPISYIKAWDLMKARGLTTTRIRQEKIVGESTLQSMREGKSVTLESLESLCRVLGCDFGDLVSYVPEKRVVVDDDALIDGLDAALEVGKYKNERERYLGELGEQIKNG